MITNKLKTAKLTGVRYHIVDKEQLLSYIKNAVVNQTESNIFNVNIHAMNLAHDRTKFKMILNKSDMVFVDGFGVKLGAKIANLPIGERLTPMDWIDDLFKLCSEHQWKIFLLGDVDSALNKFKLKLQQTHPNCQLVGQHHGFFKREGVENDQVLHLINQSGANILLVGMSMPIQEEWVWDNQDKILPHVRITTGAMHRVYTGDISRAPKWITNNGFEWLYRVCMEPRKTWRRYFLGNPRFITRVLIERFLKN